MTKLFLNPRNLDKSEQTFWTCNFSESHLRITFGINYSFFFKQDGIILIKLNRSKSLCITHACPVTSTASLALLQPVSDAACMTQAIGQPIQDEWRQLIIRPISRQAEAARAGRVLSEDLIGWLADL